MPDTLALRHLRLSVSELDDGSDKSVTATRERFKPSLAARHLRENASDRRDLDAKVGVLDHEPAPRGLHELPFRNGRARVLHEHRQNSNRPRP
jgi:hypothetical protein